jgi:hypothetical protein
MARTTGPFQIKYVEGLNPCPSKARAIFQALGSACRFQIR